MFLTTTEFFATAYVLIAIITFLNYLLTEPSAKEYAEAGKIIIDEEVDLKSAYMISSLFLSAIWFPLLIIKGIIFIVIFGVAILFGIPDPEDEP